MNLYDLNESINELNEMLENGEISEQCLNDTIESMGGTVEQKVENIVKYIRNLEKEETALKEESKHFANRANVIANKISRLKEYIKVFMQTNEISKISAGLFNVSIKKNPPALIIPDVTKVPNVFFVEQEPKLDKSALKSYIKDNGEVDYAYLEQGQSLSIK